MLYNHFYKKEITSIDVLKKVSTFQNQMTVFDFENNGNLLNLKLETFQGDIEALKSALKNGPVVLLIKQNLFGHYVVLNSKHKNFLVLDPIYGQYEIDDLEKIYEGIFIICKKSVNKTKFYFHLSADVKISIKYFLITTILNIICVVCAVIAGKYFEIVISSAIASQSISNLISLTGIFLFIYILNILSSVLLSIYKQKTLIHQYYDFFEKIIINMKSKMPSFYNKTNKNELQNIDQYCLSWLSYKIFMLTNLLTDAFVFITVVIVVATISWQFLIILFVVFAFTLLICLIDFVWKKKQVWINKNINDNFKQELTNYFQVLQNEYDFERSKIFEFSIKRWLNKQILQMQPNIIFSETLTTVKTLFDNTIYVVTIFLGAFLIINNSSINFGQITFFLAMIALQKNSVQSFFSWTSNRSLIKQYELIIQKFLYVDNINKRAGLYIDYVERIHLKDLCFNYDNQKVFINLNQTIFNKSIIRGPSGIGKSTITKIISGLIEPQSGEVYFNSISSSKIATNWKQSNILTFTTLITFPNKKIYEILPVNDPVAIEALMLMNISIEAYPNESLSFGQKQLVRLLENLNSNKKILIFDEFLVNIDYNTRHWIFLNIINPIMERNFVIWITHDPSFDTYFENVILWGEQYK